MYVTDQIRLCRVQIRSAEIKSDQASRRHYLRIAIDVVVVIVIIIFNLRRAVILVYGPAIGLFDAPFVQTGVGNNGCAHDDADHYRHFTIGLIITVDGDDKADGKITIMISIIFAARYIYYEVVPCPREFWMSEMVLLTIQCLVGAASF